VTDTRQSIQPQWDEHGASSLASRCLAGLIAITAEGKGGSLSLLLLRFLLTMTHEVSVLTEGDLLTKAHEPQVVSVGLPFLLAELRDRSALERCHVNMLGFADILALLKEGVRASVYLYTRTTGDVDICARMFAPFSGVPEDPATGSATCAVVGLLAHRDQQASGELTYDLAQGVEMGRPSRLRARAEKTNGVVTATWVGGSCVMVSEGFIHVD